jgi:hypothetical protein
VDADSVWSAGDGAVGDPGGHGFGGGGGGAGGGVYHPRWVGAYSWLDDRCVFSYPPSAPQNYFHYADIGGRGGGGAAGGCGGTGGDGGRAGGGAFAILVAFHDYHGAGPEIRDNEIRLGWGGTGGDGGFGGVGQTGGSGGQGGRNVATPQNTHVLFCAPPGGTGGDGGDGGHGAGGGGGCGGASFGILQAGAGDVVWTGNCFLESGGTGGTGGIGGRSFGSNGSNGAGGSTLRCQLDGDPEDECDPAPCG